MTLCDPKVYPHTKFGIPVSNYITDMLLTQFRFRLTDCQLCVRLAWSSSPLVAAKKCAEPSDVNVEGLSDLHDRMCIRCSGMCLSYRTTSSLGACNFDKLKSLIFLYHALWMLNMLNHNPVCRYFGYLRI